MLPLDYDPALKELVEKIVHVTDTLNHMSAINFQMSHGILEMIEDEGIEIERGFHGPISTKDH